MSDKLPAPRGELTTRTLAMPADANPSGDIFGGWVLSQMDIAAGVIPDFAPLGYDTRMNFNETTPDEAADDRDHARALVDIVHELSAR